jgi:hypothetical protein
MGYRKTCSMHTGLGLNSKHSWTTEVLLSCSIDGDGSGQQQGKAPNAAACIWNLAQGCTSTEEGTPKLENGQAYP